MGGGATGLVLSAVARLVCVPVAGTESESGFRIGAAGVRGSACTPWSGTLTSLLARLGTAEGAPTPATPMGSAAFFEGGGGLGHVSPSKRRCCLSNSSNRLAADLQPALDPGAALVREADRAKQALEFGGAEIHTQDHLTARLKGARARNDISFRVLDVQAICCTMHIHLQLMRRGLPTKSSSSQYLVSAFLGNRNHTHTHLL